jgi:CRISPR-associated endonuclease Csy4
MSQNKFKFYQEITLIPSEEINTNFLLCKVYEELHKIFSELKCNGEEDLVISFPKYCLDNLTLGDKIRIFYYSENQFKKVDLKKRLSKLLDYIHVTKIREVPSEIEYVNFSRVQLKDNKDKLARRYSKRHNIEYAEACVLYSSYKEKDNGLPFVRLKSNSNNNYYRLYIKQEKTDFRVGEFNSYGLSKDATVPCF